jgi:aminopeptidase N
MISRRTVTVAVAVAAATVLATGACQGDEPDPAPGPSDRATPAAPPAPGAAGIGDPYFPTYGNGGYDVTSYDLKVRYDPATDRLAGTATVAATATQALSRFNLDLVGLDVSAVTVDGAAATSAREDAELVVTPSAPIDDGQAFTTVVTYGGVPGSVGSPLLGTGGWMATDDGAIALGQPESASSWFPVNDHPRDKATYAIEITVPKGLSVFSNGVPGGTRDDGDWTTWTWREGDPMASYLATVVIGRYRTETGTHKDKPLVTGVSESLPRGAADAAMARTAEVADFLETQFGPYPFAAYGGVVVNDPRIRYALETQSRPVYSAAFFSGPAGDWVVAHELAHQWFGDSVSIANWRDIWLNEGFASYAEWLWEEHDRGTPVQDSFRAEYERTHWSNPAYDPGTQELFGNAVYNRGAVVVHALRLTVGDDAFFDILKGWTAEKADGNATTEEFRAYAEEKSGQELDAFFDAWLSGTTRPPLPG